MGLERRSFIAVAVGRFDTVYSKLKQTERALYDASKSATASPLFAPDGGFLLTIPNCPMGLDC